MKSWAIWTSIAALALLLTTTDSVFAQRRGTISSPSATTDPGRSARWLPVNRDPGLTNRFSMRPDPGRPGTGVSTLPAPSNSGSGTSNSAATGAARGATSVMRPASIQLGATVRTQPTSPIRLR